VQTPTTSTTVRGETTTTTQPGPTTTTLPPSQFKVTVHAVKGYDYNGGQPGCAASVGLALELETRSIQPSSTTYSLTTRGTQAFACTSTDLAAPQSMRSDFFQSVFPGIINDVSIATSCDDVVIPPTGRVLCSLFRGRAYIDSPYELHIARGLCSVFLNFDCGRFSTTCPNDRPISVLGQNCY
jgi:hypothetical protein